MKSVLKISLAVIFLTGLISPQLCFADNPQWFTKLYGEVVAAVAKHYPHATSKIADGVFYFENNAEMSVQENGKREKLPKSGGISGRVELRSGRPKKRGSESERMEAHGTKMSRSAPYFESCDCHLLVHIYTPTAEAEQVAEELQILFATANPN